MSLKNEIRSLFGNMFGNKPTNIQGSTDFRLLNDFIPYFYNYTGNMYDFAVVRSCIHTVACHAAKLKPKHFYKKNKKDGSDSFNNLLSLRPNEYMNTYDFIYKTVSQLYSSNNAFIYIRIDDTGEITGLYPVNYNQIKLIDVNGVMFAQFLFRTGIQVCIPYSQLIHIRRHYNNHDMFGDDAMQPLQPTLNVLTTINQGIINAIKSSACIRGLLKFKTIQTDTVIKKTKDEFVTDYLSINNNNGIAALDAKADFIPLTLDPKMADDKQTALFRDDIYRYFNVSEKIIKSEYNEDDYNAFYNSVIEPIAIQMSLEFTSKMFSPTEISYGNEIQFSADRMTFANMATKINLIKELMGLGLFSVNESREILEMSKLTDDFADKHITSLNYVDASKANEYQGVGNDDKPTDNTDNADSANGDANKNDN